MRSSVRTLCVTLLLTAAAFSARAQTPVPTSTPAPTPVVVVVPPVAVAPAVSPPPTVHLGFGGGMSKPLTDARNVLEDGINGQVYLAWEPTAIPLGLRLTANYDRHVLKGSSPGTGTLMSGIGGITIRFPSGPIRPYITLGCGAFQISRERDAQTASAIKFGVDAGAGLQLKLGAFGAYAECRLQNLFNPPRAQFDESRNSLEQMEAQIVPVTFGIFI